MKKLKIGTLSFIAAAFLIGCGGGSSSSSTSSVSGKVVDGPIYNAKVCVDYNFNGQCDAGEPTATTDINGTYQLKNVNLNALAPLIVVPQANTIDTFTNKPFKRKLSAPLDGSKVNISPITTIVGAQLYALKQNNDLNPQTVDQLKESIAKSLGINSDITKVDPLEDPKLAALSVTLSEVCPDVNQNFDDLEEEIDVQKLKEGNLTAAIKNDTVKQVLQNIVENQNLDELKDPKLIQIVVQNAITNGDPDVLKQNPDQLKQIALKDILTSNVFYKQEDGGYYVQFNSDGTVIDYEEDENDSDKSVKNNGSWKMLDDGSVEIDYSDGSKATFSVDQENAYIFKVQGTDSDGNKFEDTALALPNQFLNNSQVVNIQNLPGITPLKAEDFAGKYFRADYNDFIYFDQNGTAVETDDEGNTATYKWSVENGVIKLSGNNNYTGAPFTAYFVNFDKYMFVFDNENNVSRGWIYNVKDILSEPQPVFSDELIEGKTFADVENGNSIFNIFMSDGTYKEIINGSVDSTGKWSIDDDGNLIIKTDDGETYEVKLVKDLGDVVLVTKCCDKEIYSTILRTTDPMDVTINSSDDIMNINSLVGVHQFSDEMVSGKKIKSMRFGETYTFDSNGTFTETDDAGSETGTWSIDKHGVLVLNYDNDPDVDTAYVVLGESGDNEYKVLVFDVKNNKLVAATPDVEELQ